MNINIKTFDEWALDGRDESMQKGHKKSVQKMFEYIEKKTNILNRPFSFMDLGCGNGWVVRKVKKNKNCIYAIGVDGAKNMIDKAKKENIGNFILEDIQNLKFKEKYDIIFSMETFYYFSNPKKIIDNINKNALNNKGICIIGIDHYIENKSTLDWDKEYNLDLNSKSILEWEELFKNSKFRNVKSFTVNKKENWNGTLIIVAEK